ncbi:MAG: hypothetical protein JNG90_18770 [Planctomycetaceae bacterium]|nr:hypothetical protein [Planctomycetaceae bacterium]
MTAPRGPAMLVAGVAAPPVGQLAQLPAPPVPPPPPPPPPPPIPVGFAPEANVHALPAGATPESEALRHELRQAIERVSSAERELKSARELLRDQTDPVTNPDHSRRISDLETAWDRFEDQLEGEKEAKYPTAKITGFTQLDDYQITQQILNKETVGDAKNGIGFRRARLAVVGNVAPFTAYMFEMDFATAGRPSFFDVWVEQDNLPILGALRVGQELQPFSVDAQSGFRHLPFLERSLPFLAFVPFRRVGAVASNNSIDEMTYWAYSVFATGGFRNAPLGDSRFATDIGDQGGVSFSTRVTHLLEYDEPSGGRYLQHVGASYNFSQMTGNAASNSRPFYQARTLPEYGPIGDGLDIQPAGFGPAFFNTADLTPPPFVDTGRYLANCFNLFGLEWVYQAGALSLQSEFMATCVNSVAGPIWYTGGYGEFMYRLTGEHRGYDKRIASFKNPKPFTDFMPFKRNGIGGWGCWELAGRVSYISLRNPDRLLPTDYIAGTNASGNGTLTDTTLGFTWLLNYHTKVQFNWIYSILDNADKGLSSANSFVSRVQVDF